MLCCGSSLILSWVCSKNTKYFEVSIFFLLSDYLAIIGMQGPRIDIYTSGHEMSALIRSKLTVLGWSMKKVGPAALFFWCYLIVPHLSIGSKVERPLSQDVGLSHVTVLISVKRGTQSSTSKTHIYVGRESSITWCISCNCWGEDWNCQETQPSYVVFTQERVTRSQMCTYCSIIISFFKWKLSKIKG